MWHMHWNFAGRGLHESPLKSKTRIQTPSFLIYWFSASAGPALLYFIKGFEGVAQIKGPIYPLKTELEAEIYSVYWEAD